MINLTTPMVLLPTLAILVICVMISKKLKNPYIMLGILFINIGVLLTHYLSIGNIEQNNEQVLYFSLAIDFSMLLISFISYLWVDNIKSREDDKKAIDDGISWFWDKI